MTLTNFDASQITLKKREKALASWKYYNDKLVITGTSVRMEQPTYQSGLIVTLRNQGKSVCGCNPTVEDASTNYPFNGLSNSNQVQ